MAHGRFAGEQQSNACERSKEKSATLAYSNPRWPRAILGQVQLRSAPHRLVGFTQETAVMAAGRRRSFPDAFTRKAQIRTMPKTFGQRSNRASTGVSCSSATVALFLGRRIGIIGAVRPALSIITRKESTDSARNFDKSVRKADRCAGPQVIEF